MKKVLGLAISFCMLFGTVFAKGVYDGDIQLHLGLGLDSAKAVAESSFYEQSLKTTMKSGSTTVDFELSTWHLFDVNDLIGVGFNLGFSGGIGKTSKMGMSAERNGITISAEQLFPVELKPSFAGHFNGLIGPAVGFTLNDVIKFDLAVGFAYGLDLYSYEYENYDPYSRSSGVDTFMIFGAGFGFDVQAKFFPKSVVSPVLGYRLSSIFSSEVISSDLDFLSAYWDSVNYIANEIYLGVSFNW